MSLKYKLSITISGLLLLVIVMFQLLWDYNQRQKNYDLLAQSSLQLSELIYLHNTEGEINNEQKLIDLFQILRASKPYLIDQFKIFLRFCLLNGRAKCTKNNSFFKPMRRTGI